MMTPDHRKELISLIATLIWASLLTWLLMTPYAGFMVIFLILVLLILTPIRMYKSTGRAMRLELARITIWAVSVTIIFTVHHFRAAQWRETADRAAANINEYMAREGHCPENLERWMSAAEARNAGFRYSCSDGKPSLVYMDSFEAAARYYYRFETRTWEWNSG